MVAMLRRKSTSDIPLTPKDELQAIHAQLTELETTLEDNEAERRASEERRTAIRLLKQAGLKSQQAELNAEDKSISAQLGRLNQGHERLRRTQQTLSERAAALDMAIEQAHIQRGIDERRSLELAFIGLQDQHNARVASLQDQHNALVADARTRLAEYPERLESLLSAYAPASDQVTTLLDALLVYRKLLADLQPVQTFMERHGIHHAWLAVEATGRPDWFQTETAELEAWFTAYKATHHE